MFFEWENDLEYGGRGPTWWGVAAVALAVIVLSASLAYAVG